MEGRTPRCPFSVASLAEAAMTDPVVADLDRVILRRAAAGSSSPSVVSKDPVVGPSWDLGRIDVECCGGCCSSSRSALDGTNGWDSVGTKVKRREPIEGLNSVGDAVVVVFVVLGVYEIDRLRPWPGLGSGSGGLALRVLLL